MTQAPKLDVNLLVKTFDSMAALRGMYPSNAADQAQIPRSVLSHARNGKSTPSVDSTIRMVAWINDDPAQADLSPYLTDPYNEEEEE